MNESMLGILKSVIFFNCLKDSCDQETKGFWLESISCWRAVIRQCMFLMSLSWPCVFTKINCSINLQAKLSMISIVFAETSPTDMNAEAL